MIIIILSHYNRRLFLCIFVFYFILLWYQIVNSFLSICNLVSFIWYHHIKGLIKCGSSLPSRDFIVVSSSIWPLTIMPCISQMISNSMLSFIKSFKYILMLSSRSFGNSFPLSFAIHYSSFGILCHSFPRLSAIPL